MAQVVEFIGPPGAGKTSLALALDGRQVGARTVIAAQRLLRVSRRASGPSATAHGRVLTPAAPLDADPLRRLLDRLLRRELTPQELRASVRDRRDDWQDLLRLLADAPLGRGDPDPLRALYAPGWLATTLELRALAEMASDRLVVVIDEGLAQRASILCGPDADDERLGRFARALPVPTLHVHVRVPADVLMSRLQDRGRIIDRHTGLDAVEMARVADADRRFIDRVVAQLRIAGAQVLDLEVDLEVAGESTRLAEELVRALE